MDMVYCLLMAIWLLIAARSEKPKSFASRMLFIMSAVMALLAAIHTIA